MAQGKGTIHKQKHINVKYHYTRELLKEKLLDVVYCPTDDMSVDILTKALSKTKVTYLAAKMLNMNSNLK